MALTPISNPATSRSAGKLLPSMTRLIDVNRCSVRPDDLIAHQGYSVLVTDVQGWIGTGLEGVYHHQTRFLSRFHLRVEETAISCVSANVVDHHAITAYHLAPSPAGRAAEPPGEKQDSSGSEVVHKAIEIQVNAFCGTGLHMDVIVTNHGLAAAELSLMFELQADFADFNEALAGKRQQKGLVARRWEKRNMRRLLVAALCAAISCGPASAQLGPVQHIQIGPLDRTYIVERAGPADVTGGLPIIIYLHGLGTLISEGVPARFDIPFASLPGMPPALVVHPQGVDRRWDPIPARIKTWQRLAGTDGGPVDDIAFLRALIDHLVTDENGDPARVYVAGVSSGGYLVPRIACEMGDKVAAVADVIGTARQAVLKDCNTTPISFALLASTTDDTNPYAGASGSELTRLASAPDTAFFFAKHDGCTTRTETALPHLDPALPSTVSLTRFSDCADGTEVLFYRVDGSGHSVPSTAPIEAEGWNATGRRNRDIDTAQILWTFFRRHQRSTAIPPG